MTQWTRGVLVACVAFVAAAKADPPPDRDGDHIPDAVDKCPDRAVDYIETGPPDIAEVLLFAKNQDRLTPAMEQTLDAIAARLGERPDLLLAEVQGHAAEHERRPQALSERRAAIARDRLVRDGVHAARLEVQGYGATRAALDHGHACTASSETCRAHNRRVEVVAPANAAALT